MNMEKNSKKKRKLNDPRNAVLKKIKKKKVAMRSKWYFLMKRVGLESGILFAFVVGLLAISFSMYYWQSSNADEITTFGYEGWKRVLVSFPYDFLILGIFMVVSINYLVKKLEWGYKKTWRRISLISGAIIIVTSVIAVKADMNSKIEESNIPIVKDYFCRNRNMREGSDVNGSIIEIKNDSIEVKDIEGNVYELKKSEIEIRPKWYSPQAGDEVYLFFESGSNDDIWGIRKLDVEKGAGHKHN